MKTELELRERLNILLKEELDHRLKEEAQTLPHVCKNNYRQTLDNRKLVGGEVNPLYNRVSRGEGEGGVSLPVLQTMGLCMLGAEDISQWGGTLCEDPIDAKQCPDFERRLSKEEVYAQFEADISNSKWFTENLVEFKVLLWALEKTVPDSVEGVAAPVEMVIDHEFKPTWLERFFIWLCPKLTPVTPTHILPPPRDPLGRIDTVDWPEPKEKVSPYLQAFAEITAKVLGYAEDNGSGKTSDAGEGTSEGG